MDLGAAPARARVTALEAAASASASARRGPAADASATIRARVAPDAVAAQSPFPRRGPHECGAQRFPCRRIAALFPSGARPRTQECDGRSPLGRCLRAAALGAAATATTAARGGAGAAA